jgi:hypothetical protein
VSTTRSLGKKLERIRAALPPPAPPYSELPVEHWVAEEVGPDPPDWYLENTADEERFYEWLEGMPERLTLSLHVRLVRARGEPWGITDPIPSLPPEVDRRVVDALPPHIERRRRLWAENFPSRERRRLLVAGMERLRPTVKTRDNGYDWWFRTRERYARLGERYSGFEEEWATFYGQWEAKCEREGRHSLMEDRMREAFIRICFLRGAHDGEAVPD